MKCLINNLTMEQSSRLEPIDIFGRYGVVDDIHATPQLTIKADVVMFGTPEEARSLMASGRAMEIRPADRFEKEDKKRETFENIKKGDQIKYQFIRGAQGHGPELSDWMDVIKVDGDMITAVFKKKQYQNRYEFRVLRCQVVAHTPMEGCNKIAVIAQERIDTSDLKDGGCQCGAPNKYFVDFCDVCRPYDKLTITGNEHDVNAKLRRKVLEFNLV